VRDVILKQRHARGLPAAPLGRDSGLRVQRAHKVGARRGEVCRHRAAEVAHDRVEALAVERLQM
jgi:hypothetical protein